jgi:hypothetical protein
MKSRGGTEKNSSFLKPISIFGAFPDSFSLPLLSSTSYRIEARDSSRGPSRAVFDWAQDDVAERY